MPTARDRTNPKAFHLAPLLFAGRIWRLDNGNIMQSGHLYGGLLGDHADGVTAEVAPGDQSFQLLEAALAGQASVEVEGLRMTK
jgi:hypothetical protein